MSFAARLEPYARKIVPRRYHGDVLHLMAQTADAARLAWQYVPGDSTRFGPPRGVCLTPEESGVSGVQVLAEEKQDHHGKWQRLGPDSTPHPWFAQEADETIPPIKLYEFSDARVFGPAGFVIDSQDRVAGFVSHEMSRGPKRLSVFTKLRLPPVVDVPGTLAVLANDGAFNYYHYMMDVLPRLEQLRRANIHADRYFVEARFRFQKQALELAGVDAAKVVDPFVTPHVRASRVIAGTINHGRVPQTTFDFLRQTLLPRALEGGGQPGPKRLYISRANAGGRRLLCEQELMKRLVPYGFTLIALEKLDLVEQIRLFHGAELVIGPHGAGMTNIVFSQPGARLVEFFSPSYVKNTCYARVTGTLGIRYAYYIAPGGDLGIHRPTTRGDIDVGADELMEALRPVLG